MYDGDESEEERERGCGKPKLMPEAERGDRLKGAGEQTVFLCRERNGKQTGRLRVANALWIESDGYNPFENPSPWRLIVSRHWDRCRTFGET